MDLVIEDDHGDQRRAQVRFTFAWTDEESDGIPDALDLDDDNDGIVDRVELGGADLSGDSDYDAIFDYEDEDFAPCDTATNGRCDSIPSEFDTDGDGIPNHLDVDADGDMPLRSTIGVPAPQTRALRCDHQSVPQRKSQQDAMSHLIL